MRSLHVFTVVIVCLIAAAGLAAQTQITTAVIDGTVVDTSGAVLPGVDVEIRNVDTNLTRALVTDRNGRFLALQLPPGRYTVTLKLAGFATHVQEEVLASVGEAVRLTPTMKVSGVAETVTVTTTTPAVETTRTTAASTLNERTIESTRSKRSRSSR
jgi:protocatechuate 3,4-dioxygenase beta subunit